MLMIPPFNSLELRLPPAPPFKKLRTIYGQLRKVKTMLRLVSDTKETTWIFGTGVYEPEGREFESPRAHHSSLLFLNN
jgi:hypothetical protein